MVKPDAIITIKCSKDSKKRNNKFLENIISKVSGWILLVKVTATFSNYAFDHTLILTLVQVIYVGLRSLCENLHVNSLHTKK